MEYRETSIEFVSQSTQSKSCLQFVSLQLYVVNIRHDEPKKKKRKKMIDITVSDLLSYFSSKGKKKRKRKGRSLQIQLVTHYSKEAGNY